MELRQDFNLSLETLTQKQICFEELFSHTNGYEINKQATASYKAQNPNSENTIYGESRFNTIHDIFTNSTLAKEISNAKIFYDLGSGIGNVAICSSILGYFEQIHGIELMPDMHNNAVFLQETLGMLFPEIANKIHFYNESFLEHDFSSADVIFANHPIKIEYTATLRKLEEKFQALKKGAIIIYAIRPLENRENFETIMNSKFQFSWGEATVYAYKKTA